MAYDELSEMDPVVMAYVDQWTVIVHRQLGRWRADRWDDPLIVVPRSLAKMAGGRWLGLDVVLGDVEAPLLAERET